MNETEINSIYNVPLVKDIDKQIRDVFVLQCYIGQRFSDMDKINTGTIKSLHNGKCNEIVQTKTSNKVMIPLLPIAEEILERYSYNIPVYNSDTVLRKIKKIGKLAGITELHTKTIDRGGKVIEVIEPRYNFIGTHTARRSFVSNMLKRGLDSKVLMQVTGHKTDSSFMRYIKLSSEDIANTLLGQSKTNNDYDLVSIIKQEIQNQLPNCPISELNALNDKLNTIIRGLHSLGADIDLSKLSMIARTTVTLSIENISINKIIDVLIAQRCFEKTSLSLTESNTRTLSGLKILEEYPYLNI